MRQSAIWSFSQRFLPSKLPKMKFKPLVLFLSLFFVASCSVETALPQSSDIDCGLSNVDVAVPALLAKSQECPYCLLEQVKSAMPACPDDRGLLILGMYSSYKAHDLEQAAIYYERLVSSKQADASQHADAGYIYDRLGKKAEALRAFRLAVASGADAFIQFETAKLLHEMERDQEAALMLKRIIEENPQGESKNGVTIIGADAVSDEAEELLQRIENDD